MTTACIILNERDYPIVITFIKCSWQTKPQTQLHSSIFLILDKYWFKIDIAFCVF